MEIIENPDINAFQICSPSSMQEEQIIAACKAGKHAFYEKPLVVELGEACEVIEAVENSGVKMMFTFQRRFNSNFKRAKQAVVDGVVGEPYKFHLHLVIPHLHLLNVF